MKLFNFFKERDFGFFKKAEKTEDFLLKKKNGE